jgi:DNA-binding transcriptional LysR family regulator
LTYASVRSISRRTPYPDELDAPALAALIAVVDTGSFTAAAQALGVSQPAVSLAVKRLEKRLGTALLVRTRRRITPSRPGEILVAGARLAFESLDDAFATIADEQVEPSGRVILGCHESLAAYALPTFMARFLRAYPKVEIKLWNGTSAQVEHELVHGRVDLGLIVNPTDHPDTVVLPAFDDSVELFHCLSSAASTPAADLLAQVPLIYVPELRQSQDVLSRLRARSTPLSRLLPCSSLELVKSLVIDQVGIGILPRRVAMHATRKKLRSLSPPMPRYRDHITIVRRYDLPRTAAIRVALENLTAHGRAMSQT